MSRQLALFARPGLQLRPGDDHSRRAFYSAAATGGFRCWRCNAVLATPAERRGHDLGPFRHGPAGATAVCRQCGGRVTVSADGAVLTTQSLGRACLFSPAGGDVMSRQPDDSGPILPAARKGE